MPKLTADQALEKMMSRIAGLSGSLHVLRELDLENHRNGLGLFHERGSSLEPNPDYKTQKRAFDAELARRPRSSSWVRRNRPDSHRSVFPKDSILLNINIRDERTAPVQASVAPNRQLGPFHIIALTVDGPKDSATQEVWNRVTAIIDEEITAYNASNRSGPGHP